jgi:hypothetical protein
MTMDDGTHPASIPRGTYTKYQAIFQNEANQVETDVIDSTLEDGFPKGV